MSNAAGTKIVFAICFCLLCRSNQCTFKIGMFINIDVIAFITSINSCLFIHTRMISIDFRFIETPSSSKTIAYRHTTTYIHLFAMIARFILQTFNIQVFSIKFYSFAFYLATNNIGITTGLNHGFTLAISNMTSHIRGFITITVTFSVITPYSNPCSRTITHFNGYPCIKAT